MKRATAAGKGRVTKAKTLTPQVMKDLNDAIASIPPTAARVRTAALIGCCPAGAV